MNWYVVQTKPRRERDVLGQLSSARFEIFLPRIKTYSSSKPLFPSYLFVCSDFDDPHKHQMVRFTRGVSRILGDGEGPKAVPEIIIKTLIERTRDGSLIEQELLFRIGDCVRVKRGILKDLAGIIEKNASESGRVEVLFKWLNANMRAFLDYRALEKIT